MEMVGEDAGAADGEAATDTIGLNCMCKPPPPKITRRRSHGDTPAPVHRDLSVALPEEMTPEEVGDRVRTAPGPRAGNLETVKVLSETPHGRLPPAARERITCARGGCTCRCAR